MAMVDADWSIDRATGNIRYIGDDHGGASPSYATVIQFHRWLQDFADDADSTGDDELAIYDDTPSDRSTDNIITLINSFNIDATASEHLYDGSVIQLGGDNIYDGIVNFGNADVQIQLIKDGTVLTDDWWNFSGAGLNPDVNQGISHRFMVPVRADGVDIDRRRILGTSRTYENTFSEFPINGTSRGNNVLALSDTNDLNNNTVAGTVATWTTITNTEGLRLIDIDNNTVNEEYYSEWNKDTFTINQFYERMKWLTRDGSVSTLNGLNGELFRGITHSFAYDTETGTMFTTNSEGAFGDLIAYDNEATGPFVVGEAIHGPGATPAWKGRVLAVDDDGITGTLVVDLESGTLTNNDSFAGQTSGATADLNDVSPPTAPTAQAGVIRFFAVDDDGTTGNLYGQLMKGVAPANNTRIYDDVNVANFVDVNGAVTSRPIATPFIGQSTGSAIIGAYGIGMETTDVSAADQFTDLSGATITPPNNVTFTVFGLVSTEDRVLVTNDLASGIDYAQRTLQTTLNGAAETAVVVTAAIPSDTPASGTIRIELDDGRYRLQSYTSWTGSTFTIPSTSYVGANAATAPKDVFISYIDKVAAATSEAFTVVYSSDRTLFIRVRDGGATPIKTFETTATLGSGGGSATAIRTSDT